MPEAAIAVLLIAFPLVGFATQSRLAIGLPLVCWPLYFLGLNEGLWGYGTGDNWEYGAAVLTLVGVITTALAVALPRSRWPRPRRPS